jgi:hypothetical protein
MASKNGGGGRKRGRPVTLTPEQRLERERERWHRKKVRQRKAAQDAAWLRDTPSGYFVQLWVPHYTRLVEALVGVGYLDAANKDIAQRVDAAVDEVLKDYVRSPSYGFRESGVVKAGAVRVRMTKELASKLADAEYARRFPPHSLRLADENVEFCRRWDLEDKAYTAREQRKPLFLRVPRKKIIEVSDILRDAEAERDQIRRGLRTPEEFKEEFLQNRGELTRAAERHLSHFCDSYVPDQPSSPCNCKLRLPECDCLSRFRPSAATGALPMRPGPQRPWGARPLVKQDLYSGPKPRWWTERRYNSGRNDDPIIRSHDKAASVSMKGFDAGGRDVWKNDKAIYYPEQDNRGSTRDWNRTAREGEKALQKPYDDPTGTPKSWSNPSDVAPDSEDTIIRIGKRVIEDGEIEPYMRKKGYSEDDE